MAPIQNGAKPATTMEACLLCGNPAAFICNWKRQMEMSTSSWLKWHKAVISEHVLMTAAQARFRDTTESCVENLWFTAKQIQQLCALKKKKNDHCVFLKTQHLPSPGINTALDSLSFQPQSEYQHQHPIRGCALQIKKTGQSMKAADVILTKNVCACNVRTCQSGRGARHDPSALAFQCGPNEREVSAGRESSHADSPLQSGRAVGCGNHKPL